ncbi:MAG: SOS response-associated peptidase [Pirellulales bacterium]
MRCDDGLFLQCEQSMCGRFTFRTPEDVILAAFDAVAGRHYQQAIRYNLAPTQLAPVIRSHDGRRELTSMKWGLIPSWSKDGKMIPGTINARGDTLAEKPSFRTAYKKRRCLIIADGYYEWRTEGKKKLPFIYELDGGKPIAFAGLFEQWWGKGEDKRPDDDPLQSCTIVTTDANKLASEIHDRMPVILDPSDYDEWLDPTQQDTTAVAHLLKSYEGDALTVRGQSLREQRAERRAGMCGAQLGIGQM